MRALACLVFATNVASAKPIVTPTDVFAHAEHANSTVYWRIPTKPAVCQAWTFGKGALHSHDKLLSFRYRIDNGTLVLEGAHPSRDRAYSTCTQTLTPTGDDQSQITFANGAWYWSAELCRKAVTAIPPGCAAVITGAIATPTKQTGRTPFEKRIQGGGKVWTLTPSLACEAWTIRNEKFSRKDGTYYGISLDKATLELTGPNASGPGGDVGVGSLETYAVVNVNATTTLVGGSPWFLTARACDAARKLAK
jgi:hypothetical protein